MEIHESQMKKVFDNKNGRLKQYMISLGVTTEINEDKFYQNEKGKDVCDVIIVFPDEFNEVIHQHEKSQSTIQELEKTIADHEKTIRDMKKQLSNIQSRHKKEIINKDDEYSDKVDELNEVIHNKAIEIEETKTKYEREIGSLKESHQKEISQLVLFDKDKHMKISDHNEKINNLILFDADKHMKISEHNKEINSLKNSIVRETIKYNNNLNELKGINIIKYIKGDLKDIIKDMESSIDYLKQIGEYDEGIETEINLKEGEK